MMRSRGVKDLRTTVGILEGIIHRRGTRDVAFTSDCNRLGAREECGVSPDLQVGNVWDILGRMSGCGVHEGWRWRWQSRWNAWVKGMGSFMQTEYLAPVE
jgi:hypothetical protein